MLAIPLICLLFPGHVTAGRYVVYMVLWYTLAKLCELFDGEIFALLGHTVSGHALKHLAAALAAYMVLAMLRAATVSPAPHPKTSDA
jgi:predicted aconitase